MSAGPWSDSEAHSSGGESGQKGSRLSFELLTEPPTDRNTRYESVCRCVCVLQWAADPSRLPFCRSGTDRWEGRQKEAASPVQNAAYGGGVIPKYDS